MFMQKCAKKCKIVQKVVQMLKKKKGVRQKHVTYPLLAKKTFVKVYFAKYLFYLIAIFRPFTI